MKDVLVSAAAFVRIVHTLQDLSTQQSVFVGNFFKRQLQKKYAFYFTLLVCKYRQCLTYRFASKALAPDIEAFPGLHRSENAWEKFALKAEKRNFENRKRERKLYAAKKSLEQRN